MKYKALEENFTKRIYYTMSEILPNSNEVIRKNFVI